MRPLSGKECCVLELLAERGELYGLELVGASGGALKRGTVYVTLARMEEKGLVRGALEQGAAPHPGLPRRLYRPTALGLRLLDAHRAFASALAAPIKGRA
ncbi:MAG TPA: PadR family transcriptional regulator [Polyangiaceae bacterium]|nr:PadR family transcriptional regulator [Polyangiaceae bacterium]